MGESKVDESKVDEFNIEINDNYLIETYSSDVRRLIQDGNVGKLKELYDILAEVNDVDKGKIACIKLYTDCFEDMIKIVKDGSDNVMKYCVWHFLQLMTCCVQVKEILYDDYEVIPLLLQLNTCHWHEEKMMSLKSISLNFILVMLADATDQYYEYIASTEVIPFFYKLLETSVLNPEDSLVELLVLGLNLLLEGSSHCKRQLIDLDFKSLMCTKIEQRENCNDEMLKIANQTYQKFLLLGSEGQSFVETFRHCFNEEIRKNNLYLPVICYNTGCKGPNELSADYSPTTFKRCARCKAATYCSKQCQVAHWKESHSKICTPSTKLLS